MRRILFVVDDPHICHAIRVWLQRYGFKVSIADGGSEGLAALDHSTFDLMIVDIFMPEMRGLESIRVFHNHAPTVPLIAISGSAFSGPELFGSDFLQMATRLGATRRLRKPFRPTTLLAVIGQCLSEVGPHRRYFATADFPAISWEPGARRSHGGLGRRPFRARPLICGRGRSEKSAAQLKGGGGSRAVQFRGYRTVEAEYSAAGDQHATYSCRR